jgi:hypothetical protein
MACSLWDSLQGFWASTPDPRTSFPTPFQGGPIGLRKAQPIINNFSRVSQDLLSCKLDRLTGFAFRSFFRLPEAARFCKLDRFERLCFSATSSSYRRLPFLASFAVLTGSALVQLFKTNTVLLRLQAASIFQVIAALSNCKIRPDACPELHLAWRLNRVCLVATFRE